MKFKWKLFLSYLVIVLIPFLVAERFIASHLNHRLIEQTEERLLKEALLIKTLLEKSTTQPFRMEQMDPLIKKVGRDIEARITFIDSRGAVLGDTDVPFEQLKNLGDHSRRPEFITAFNRHHGVTIRYSTTLDMEMMYLAIKVSPGDTFLGVVRVALPLTEIRDLIARTEQSLIVAFLLCALLILILNILAAKRLSQPIVEITQAAKAISGGDYNVKVYTGGRGKELETLGRAVNTMATEIQKRVREITQEKETLNTILRSMTEGVMVVDDRGRIILINSVLPHLFGHTQTPIGKSPIEVIRNAELQDGVTGVLQSGEPFSMELCVATRESDKVFDVTVTRLMPDEKIEGAVVVLHDITDLKRINTVRKDFVANVSHELRTPLTAIKGYAETISHGKLEDISKIESFSGIILKHANRLSALVEDLLSLTRLESEQSAPEKEEINLREVLDAAISVIKPGADEKQLHIQTNRFPDRLMTWADRGQISQALINLLDNAVKYTPEEGTVKVWAEYKGDEIHITVHDTGIGIPREDLDRIFERFYRVDRNRSRDMGGTGLGLSIVKHIIQGHGGKVWATSRSRDGSALTFTLPSKKNQDGTDRRSPQ